MMKKLLLIPFILIVLSASALAQECAGTLSAPGTGVEVGDTFDVTFFNGDAGSTGDTLTLTLPVGLSTASTNPVVGVTPFTATTWSTTATAAGTYLLTADLTTVGCNKNFTLDVGNGFADPLVDITIQDRADLIVGQATAFNVDLTNNGAGDAQNITGIAVVASGATLSPTTFSLASLAATATDSSSYTITPSACGADSLTIQVNSYEDIGGEQMAPVSQVENYNVIGTDMEFFTFSASSTSVTSGSSVTFTMDVTNNGARNVSSGLITLFRDADQIATVSIPSLAVGVTDRFTTAWTVSGSNGDHTIRAVASGSEECSGSNEATLNMTISGTPSSSSGGGGGGGGGSYGHVYWLEVSKDIREHAFEVQRHDRINYRLDGEIYDFFFTDIDADLLEVKVTTSEGRSDVIIPEGGQMDFDMDGDGNDDLRITALWTNLGRGTVVFRLLSAVDYATFFELPETVSTPVILADNDEEEEEPLHPEVEQNVGMISFVEELEDKKTVPVGVGAGISVAILLLGLGGYFLIRKPDEEL